MIFPKNPDVARFHAIGVVFSQHFCRAAATVGIVLLAACAAPKAPVSAAAGAASSREAVVRERVQGRWDAMIRDDLDAAYGYFSAGSRSTISLDNFKRATRRGAFRAAKIESVDCDASACRARLLVTYDHRLMKGITTPLTESWVFDNDQAWYVYRE